MTARQARNLLRAGQPSVLAELASGDPDRIDAPLVFAAAARGDPAAVTVVARAAQALVTCVVSLPTFAPSPLRDALGLVENRPALLRTPPLAGHPRAVGAPPRRSHATGVTRRPNPAGQRARRLGAAPGLGLCGRISDTHDWDQEWSL